MYIKIKSYNESGYAAIIISMLIMVIVGLIALGFSATTRHDQQVTLDNALSTEAYYAAESGINTAYSIITAYEKAGQNLANLPVQTNNCIVDNSHNNVYTNSSISAINSSASYSCLLVNPEPYSLEYKPIVQNVGEAFPVQNTSATNIARINISWQTHNLNSALSFSNCPPPGKFPSIANYTNCSAPILELDIVPMNDVKNSTSFIISRTNNYFIFPYNGRYLAVNNFNGHVLVGNCSSTLTAQGEFTCNVMISPPRQSSGYYVHIVPYYSSADVSVTAFNSNLSNNQISFFGSQALIDSTGVASGVSRRIEERICISTICNNQAPSQAILSQNSICKDFTARPGSISNRAPISCGGL